MQEKHAICRCRYAYVRDSQLSQSTLKKIQSQKKSAAMSWRSLTYHGIPSREHDFLAGLVHLDEVLGRERLGHNDLVDKPTCA